MTNDTTPSDQSDDLALLNDIIRAMRDGLTIRQALEQIVQRMAQTFGVSDCGILLFEHYTAQAPIAMLYLCSPEAASLYSSCLTSSVWYGTS